MQVPYTSLSGKKIAIGFSISIVPTDRTLTGDFTKSYGDYEDSKVNIQTGLQIGARTLPNLTPSIISYNLQEQVSMGDIANGSIEMSFGDFAGSVNIFVFDRGDFDVDGNPDRQDQNLQSILPTLDKIGFNYIDDSAKYGLVDFVNGSSYGKQLQVSQGQSISVPFSYTPYTTGQDSFTIYIVYNRMDSTLPLYLLEYFDNLVLEQKWYLAQNCNINIVQEQDLIIEQEEYTPPATGEDYEPSEDGGLIENPIDIMFHLSEQELGYNKPINAFKINEARENHPNWRLGFSVNSQIEGKKLLSEFTLNHLNQYLYFLMIHFHFLI